MREVLADLFLMASEAVARQLRHLGTPLTVTVQNRIIEREVLGNWRTVVDGMVSVNILALDIANTSGRPFFLGSEYARIRQCALSLADSARATLPFWAPLGPRAHMLLDPVTDGGSPNPDFESDPAEWVSLFILLPALESRLAKLPSVESADEVSAIAFADEVLHVAHDDRLRYQAVIPLSGIDLDTDPGDQFSQGEISVRRLTPHEQSYWFEKVHGRDPQLGVIFDPPRVAFELTSSGPRASQNAPSVSPAQRLIMALELHGHWVAGRFVHESAAPEWVSAGSMHMPLTLPRRVNTLSVLTKEGFKAVIDTARKLNRYDMEKPKSPQDLALHRFIVGAARENSADAVLDFTIALEALLLPYDPATRRGDLSYRFRIHGAHYLSANIGQRKAIAKRLETVYGLRSRLVHGAKYPDAEKIMAAGNDSRELARIGLLHAVRDSFPTAVDFNRIVLGIESESESGAEVGDPHGR